jgi:hypothetical protein
MVKVRMKGCGLLSQQGMMEYLLEPTAEVVTSPT